MFIFGLKARTSEVLRRATSAMMSNQFIDKALLQELDISDSARSALFFEAHAHCLFAAHSLFQLSIAKDKPWATIEFFLQCVSKPFAEADKRGNLSEGSIAHYIIPRFMSIGHTFHEQKIKDIYSVSVSYVIEKDIESNMQPDGTSSSLADDDLIRAFLIDASESFFSAISPMFTLRE